MKQLTQDIFKGLPEWVKSAAIGDGGTLWCSRHHTTELKTTKVGWVDTNGDKSGTKMIGKGWWGYGSNWQNSAIDRESVK